MMYAREMGRMEYDYEVMRAQLEDEATDNDLGDEHGCYWHGDPDCDCDDQEPDDPDDRSDWEDDLVWIREG